MRTMVKAALLGAVSLSAVITLSACDSSSTSDAGSSPSAADSPAPASAIAASPSGSASSSGSNGSSNTGGSSKSSGSAGGGTGAAGGAAMCHTSNLSITNEGGNDPLTVIMKNTGSSSCSMKGYPGATLKDSMGDNYDVKRDTSETPKVVTLAPGAEASFGISWPINKSGGSGVTFTTLVVTPPNETHSVTLKAQVNVAADGDKTSSDPIKVSPVESPS